MSHIRTEGDAPETSPSLICAQEIRKRGQVLNNGHVRRKSGQKRIYNVLQPHYQYLCKKAYEYPVHLLVFEFYILHNLMSLCKIGHILRSKASAKNQFTMEETYLIGNLMCETVVFRLLNKCLTYGRKNLLSGQPAVRVTDPYFYRWITECLVFSSFIMLICKMLIVKDIFLFSTF